jgi:hypothetical protein
MNDELSDFTKLVLARLETNPDEFQLGGRWDTLVRGLEAYAIDETENRYHRTLWPLTDHERTTILEAYRKAYLARLHKDMLKNIVSGDDLPKTLDPSKVVIRGTSPTTLMTPASIANTALGVLQKEFDKSYNDAFSNAIVKGEGQAVMPDSNTAYTYKPTNRYSLNSSQLAVAKRLGVDPGDYARQLERFQE